MRVIHRPEKSRRQPDDNDKHIGRRIRTQRQYMGLSMAKLGKLVGVSPQQVAKIEHGQNRASGSRLMKLAEALQCDVASFVAGASTNGLYDDPGIRFLATKEGAMVVKAFAFLDPTMRRAIADLATAAAYQDK